MGREAFYMQVMLWAKIPDSSESSSTESTIFLSPDDQHIIRCPQAMSNLPAASLRTCDKGTGNFDT